ncbi:ribonuclease H-like domain-containing protein [Tanacetum coccineum]
MQTQWNIEIPESPLESKVNEDTPNEVLWSKIGSELPWLKSESELPSSKSKKSPSKSRKSPPNINLLNYHVRRYTRGLEKWIVGDGNMSLSGCFVELLYVSNEKDLRYVRDTFDHGLQLHVSSIAQLIAYTDADWAGFLATRRSTFGYCVFFGDNLLSWSAKRQVTLSCSSAETEYRGVANVVVETVWIRNLLLRVLHVPSKFQYADIFTKGLPMCIVFGFSLQLERSKTSCSNCEGVLA